MFYHVRSSADDSISLFVSSLKTKCNIRMAPRVKRETANEMKNKMPTSLLVPPKELVDVKYTPFFPLN
jgi:hypothetical protein